MKSIADYEKRGYKIIPNTILGKLESLIPNNCHYRDIKTERIVGGDIYISNEEKK